jgi:hypothetical protein
LRAEALQVLSVKAALTAVSGRAGMKGYEGKTKILKGFLFVFS